MAAERHNNFTHSHPTPGAGTTQNCDHDFQVIWNMERWPAKNGNEVAVGVCAHARESACVFVSLCVCLFLYKCVSVEEKKILDRFFFFSLSCYSR